MHDMRSLYVDAEYEYMEIRSVLLLLKIGAKIILIAHNHSYCLTGSIIIRSLVKIFLLYLEQIQAEY